MVPLLNLPTELLMITESLLNTASSFSLMHVSRYFRTFITKLRPDLANCDPIFERMNTIIIESIDHPDLFKWLFPDPTCFTLDHAHDYCGYAIEKGSFEIMQYIPKRHWININPYECSLWWTIRDSKMAI